MCMRVHDLPADFDYDPVRREMVDRSERPELMSASVEYIAPGEYMVRPPQPCVYIFLIDCSTPAIAAGLPQAVCEAIMQQLEEITGDSRTKVAFITYSNTLQFYNLRCTLSQPQMMVVGELDEEVFLPAPDDLLVNLLESVELVKQLMASLPTMVAHSPGSAQSCLGHALLAARQLLGGVGGRVLVFQAVLPDLGVGALTNREDVKLRGTSKEYESLEPGTDWHKQFAVDANRLQITVDLFVCSTHYVDLCALSHLARFSAGGVNYYPGFSNANPAIAIKLKRDIAHALTKPVGLEAVMRIRATKGLALHTYHGHFFVRATDLVAMPSVSPDQGYAFEIGIDEKLGDTQPYAYFQTAVLYTTSNGERRIRVHTLAVPVTSDLPTVFANADGQAIAALVAKLAVDRALSAKVDEARQALTNLVPDALAAFRATMSATPGALMAPEALRSLPLMMNALLKHPAFRPTTTLSLDERAFALTLIKTLPLWELVDYIYPRMYGLHDMAANVALRDDANRLPMPPVIQLSAERLQRGGIYLVVNTQDIIVWVSRGASPELTTAIFNTPPEAVPEGPINLPRLDTLLSTKVRNIVFGLRNCHYRYLMLTIVREDSPRRNEFLQYMLDDRLDNVPSYYENISKIASEVAR
eukprot:m.142118 g.142118  ORF g.142118 m.142118 type:complete len:642 (-) comp9640_c0_seq6:98-2023(-)